MTRTEAHDADLDLLGFTSMDKALRYACRRLTKDVGTARAVACFRETIAGFDVFFVATKRRAGAHVFMRGNNADN